MREKKSGDVIDNDSNDEWVVVAIFHHDHYLKFLKIRNSHGRCSVKKEFLKISQNSQENTWVRVLFLINLQASPATSLKETLTQVFSCELCKIFKNTYFIEHVRRRLLLENHLIQLNSCRLHQEHLYKYLIFTLQLTRKKFNKQAKYLLPSTNHDELEERELKIQLIICLSFPLPVTGTTVSV